MVSLQTKVRDKLQAKVFAKIGKTVTYSALTASTTDERGDFTVNSYTDSTITIVPYDITADELLHEEWGDIEAGKMDIAIPYTTTVGLKDKISIDSQDYEIDVVHPNLLPDNVVTIARVKKVQF